MNPEPERSLGLGLKQNLTQEFCGSFQKTLPQMLVSAPYPPHLCCKRRCSVDQQSPIHCPQCSGMDVESGR